MTNPELFDDQNMSFETLTRLFIHVMKEGTSEGQTHAAEGLIRMAKHFDDQMKTIKGVLTDEIEQGDIE